MTITQAITALPPAPDPAIDSPAEFSQKAANSVLAQRALPGELNAFGAQANALADDVTVKAASTSAAAQTAEAAVAAVVAVAGVGPWVSGRTYAKNDAVISQVNFQTYRRSAAGAGTTDPANDTSGAWALLIGSGSFIPVRLAASSIDLSLGNYFTRTMSANQTFTFDKCPQEGYSFTLELTMAGGSVTFPASVRTPENVAYVLTTGKTHLLTFVTSDRGQRWRMVAAPNFDT